MTTSLQQSGGATLGLTIDQRCGRAPPRLHPGITQEVAPNESQRTPVPGSSLSVATKQ